MYNNNWNNSTRPIYVHTLNTPFTDVLHTLHVLQDFLVVVLDVIRLFFFPFSDFLFSGETQKNENIPNQSNLRDLGSQFSVLILSHVTRRHLLLSPAFVTITHRVTHPPH